MTREEYDNRMKEISARDIIDIHKSLLQTQAGIIYIASLEKQNAILSKALVMMSGRLFLVDNYENKPNWTYVYDKYIGYAAAEEGRQHETTD